MAKYSDKQAIDELNQQIDEIDKVRKKPRLSAKFKTWKSETGELMERVFGRNAKQVKDFDTIPYTLAAFSNQTPESKFDEAFQQGLQKAAIVLSSAIKDIKKGARGGKPQSKEPEPPAREAPKAVNPAPSIASSPPPAPVAASPAMEGRSRAPLSSSKIFIVYADSSSIKNDLMDFISRIGVTPITIQDRPGQQNLLLGKLQQFHDVGYAVVLLNPAATGISHEVAFELGILVGALGKDRVCGLVKEKLDIMANYSGISYVPHDPAGAWKFMLIKQLKHAGFEVDANLAL